MKTKHPYEVLTWDAFYGLARGLAHKIRDSGYVPDMIVAIGRGGYVPARILSDQLDIANLTSFKIEHYRRIHKSPQAVIRYPLSAEVNDRRILLVDDVTDTGDTFSAAIRHLRERGNPRDIKTAVLDHKTVSPFVPDYYVRVISDWHWIIYPWAVVEDLTAIGSNLTPRAQNPEDLARYLDESFRIRVPTEILDDVLHVLLEMETARN
jgi:hypoxanthine phosphoribosyltransferase